ncbi:MAG: hypothetical protein ACLUBL_02010 [Fusobacterium sp.]|uniref:hypothetical protein n=1 Tax=Fusobacterium sp. TaxID=68766 RepID=UPI003992CA5A
MYALNAVEQKKQRARIIIITGGTLKQASKESGLTINQVKKMSTKENLKKKRLDLLKEFYNENWERIKANKNKRLELNSLLLDDIEREIKKNGATIEVMKRIILNELVEQIILEFDKLTRWELSDIQKKLSRIK